MTGTKSRAGVYIPDSSDDLCNRNMATHREATDPVLEQLDDYTHRIQVSHDEAHARARRFYIRNWLDWVQKTGHRFKSPRAAAEAYAPVLRDEYSPRMTKVHLDTIHDFVDYLEGGDGDE